MQNKKEKRKKENKLKQTFSGLVPALSVGQSITNTDNIAQ